MTDLAMIGVTLVFLLTSIGLIAAFERVRGS